MASLSRPALPEYVTQRHSCVVQLRLRRSTRDVQHAGDFFVPVPFDIVQHQDLPRPIRKPLDRGFDIEREPGRQVPSRQPIERFRIVGVTLPFDPQRLAPGQDQVQSKAVQPGAECRIAAKRAELARS
jgi:hypothetical protein